VSTPPSSGLRSRSAPLLSAHWAVWLRRRGLVCCCAGGLPSSARCARYRSSVMPLPLPPSPSPVLRCSALLAHLLLGGAVTAAKTPSHGESDGGRSFVVVVVVCPCGVPAALRVPAARRRPSIAARPSRRVVSSAALRPSLWQRPVTAGLSNRRAQASCRPCACARRIAQRTGLIQQAVGSSNAIDARSPSACRWRLLPSSASVASCCCSVRPVSCPFVPARTTRVAQATSRRPLQHGDMSRR
jgi:hypothetical protein